MSASNIIKTMPDDMLNIKSNVVTKPSNESFKFFFAFLEKKVEKKFRYEKGNSRIHEKGQKIPRSHYFAPFSRQLWGLGGSRSRPPT
jgi:hypothetical protein